MPEQLGRRGPVGRIYGNLAKILGGKATAGIISLGYLALASRTLGPTEFGVLMLVHGYANTVGGLAGLPGWQAVVRYGALALAAGDLHRLTRLLRLVAVVEGVGAVLAVVAAAALAPILGPHLGWSPEVVAFALPYSLAVMAQMRMTPLGYLQLEGRFDLIAFHHLVSPLCRLVGVFAAVALHAGIVGFLTVWLISTIVEMLVTWGLGLWIASRRLPGHRIIGPVRGAVAENPGFWKFLVGAKADVTLTEAPVSLIPLLIGWVLGPAATGLYTIALRSTAVLAQPAMLLGQAAYSELARMAAAGDSGTALRKALVHCVAVAAMIACPVTLLIMVLAPHIAVWMAGPKFAAAAPIMMWVATARTVAMLSPPVSSALIALGLPSRSVIANTIGGIGMLALLPPMMTWAGLNGAGLNLLLQSTVTAALLIWFVVRETGPARAGLAQ